jgi:hypothetical protein
MPARNTAAKLGPATGGEGSPQSMRTGAVRSGIAQPAPNPGAEAGF